MGAVAKESEKTLLQVYIASSLWDSATIAMLAQLETVGPWSQTQVASSKVM